MTTKTEEAISNLKARLNQFRIEQSLKGADKWGSLQQRFRWALIQITEAVAYLAVGVIESLITIVLKSYTVFPLLFYGIILIVARWMLLQMMKVLIVIAVVPVDIINAILGFLDVGVNLVIFAVDTVLSFINVIIDAIKVLDPHLHFKDIELIKWTHIDFLSITEFRHVLQTTITTCQRFDSFSTISLFLVRMGLHEYTCAATRYMYPVSWIFDIVNWLLGWTFYGTAAPFPLEAGANCAASEANTVYDDICCGLGIGFLFVEFFLPTVLIYIVLRALSTSLLRFGSLAVYGLEVGLELAIDGGLLVFEELFE